MPQYQLAMQLDVIEEQTEPATLIDSYYRDNLEDIVQILRSTADDLESGQSPVDGTSARDRAGSLACGHHAAARALWRVIWLISMSNWPSTISRPKTSPTA